MFLGAWSPRPVLLGSGEAGSLPLVLEEEVAGTFYGKSWQGIYVW